MDSDDVVVGHVTQHAFRPGNINSDKCIATVSSSDNKFSCGLSASHSMHFPAEPANLPAPRPSAEGIPPEQQRILAVLQSPPTTVQEVLSFFEECASLVEAKDAAYGGAWRKQGWMGNVSRIMSKTARLQNMLWRDEPVMESGGESVVQTLKDLSNLCAFAAKNIEEGNRWGR